MNFLSVLYIPFLASVILLYWFDEQPRTKMMVLLLASLIFYAYFQAEYVPLLLVGTWVNFRLGRELALPPDWRRDDWQFAQHDWNQRRSRLLWFGIGLNVLLLFGFKYIPFSLNTVASILGWQPAQTAAQWTGEHLIAPLGISFFCFECIAYLVDVYRGAPAAQEWLSFFSYKLFFAKLLSGPITRFQAIAPQLQNPLRLSVERLSEGLWLIACGAVKKGLIADNLSTLVNLSFQNVQRAGSGDLWLATAAYGLQLYLDFSGYVDIARGTAVLLGFNLPQNFDFPYFSTSIADFWRRWHITLGDWLRNYLYFPLGGSRQGLARTCLNLLIVMAIAGLWHGAAWGFVVWGVLHGMALVVHRLTDALAQQLPRLQRFWQNPLGILTGWLLTQLMVLLAWIFFRLPNLKESWLVITRLYGHAADAQFAQKVYIEALGLQPLQIWLVLGLIVAAMAIAYGIERRLKVQLNWNIKLMAVPACLFAVWLFGPQGAPPYIYFDF
jgi:alginate O-acetyltransferase complex protein AlgI